MCFLRDTHPFDSLCLLWVFSFSSDFFFSELSLFISSILIDGIAADTYFPFSSLHGGHSYHSSYSCHFMAWIFTYTNSLGLHCLGQRDSFFCWVNLLSSWIQFTFPLLLQENVMNILAILLILVYVFKTKTGGRKYSLLWEVMSWMLS